MKTYIFYFATARRDGTEGEYLFRIKESRYPKAEARALAGMVLHENQTGERVTYWHVEKEKR